MRHIYTVSSLLLTIVFAAAFRLMLAGLRRLSGGTNVKVLLTRFGSAVVKPFALFFFAYVGFLEIFVRRYLGRVSFRLFFHILKVYQLAFYMLFTFNY